MTLSIVDPNSTELQHLSSVDVEFSGTHIGAGIYLASNHNPDTDGRVRVSIPQRGLLGEAEAHDATEIDFAVPDGADPNDYRDDLNNDGTPDSALAGFDVSLFHGDRLTSTGEFYAGPAAPLLIANDPNDLIGQVEVVGYPSAANSLDGTDGTLHTTSGDIVPGSYNAENVGSDEGGAFTILGATGVGGMSGGGTFVERDLDGDSLQETYLIGVASRAGTLTLEDSSTTDAIVSTYIGPHYIDLATAIEGLAGLEARSADDFARMALLSAQTLGSTNTLVQGTFFHEDIYGGVNSDQLLGARGDDFISGLEGNDVLDGGEGADTIDGGLGSDDLSGGTGADLFIGFGTGGIDTVSDFTRSEGDVLDLSAFFATRDDVVAATSDLGDGSIRIDLPAGLGGRGRDRPGYLRQ